MFVDAADYRQQVSVSQKPNNHMAHTGATPDPGEDEGGAEGALSAVVAGLQGRA